MHDEAIAAAIQRLTDLLTRQVQQAGGWPACLKFPAPGNQAEREALTLFLNTLRTEMPAADITVSRVTSRHASRDPANRPSPKPLTPS